MPQVDFMWVLLLLAGAAAQQAPAPGTQWTLSTGQEVFTGQKVMAYFLSDNGKSTEPDLSEIVSVAGGEVIIKFVSDGVQQSVAESWLDLSRPLNEPLPGIQSQAPGGGGDGGDGFAKVIVKKLGHMVLAVVPAVAGTCLIAATSVCRFASQNTPLDFILALFTIFFLVIVVNRISEGNPPKAPAAQKGSGSAKPAAPPAEASFFSHLVFLLLFAVYVLLVMDFTKGGMNLVSPLVNATGQDPETCAVMIGGGATLLAVIVLQFGGSSSGSGGAGALPAPPGKKRTGLWISAFICAVLIIADLVQLYIFEGKPIAPLQEMLVKTSNVDMNAKELSTLLGVIPGVLLLRTLAEFAMGPPGGGFGGTVSSFLAWEATLTKQADGESWGLRVCDAGSVTPPGLKVEALQAENTAAGRFNAAIPGSGSLEETAIRIADRVIAADMQAGAEAILGRLKAGNSSVHLLMTRGQATGPVPGSSNEPVFKLEVTLEKNKQGESLGLKLNEVPETGQLRIDEVREGDSPATRHNGSLPPGDTQALKAGDIVFSAGGVSGPTNKVLDVLRAQQKVKLVLIRPGLKMNQRPKLTLQRSSPGESVGLVVRGASDGSGVLEVAAVTPTGVIPNGAICVGDQIVSVNGKTDMASMSLELGTQQTLELEVRTWGDAGPAQPMPVSRAVTAPAAAPLGFSAKAPSPVKPPTQAASVPNGGAVALTRLAEQLAATESRQQQMISEIFAELNPHRQRLTQLQSQVREIGAAQGKTALDLVAKTRTLLDSMSRAQVTDGAETNST